MDTNDAIFLPEKTIYQEMVLISLPRTLNEQQNCLNVYTAQGPFISSRALIPSGILTQLAAAGGVQGRAKQFPRLLTILHLNDNLSDFSNQQL